MNLSEVLNDLLLKLSNVKWATFYSNKGTADTNVSVVSEQPQQDAHVYRLCCKHRQQNFGSCITKHTSLYAPK